MGTPCTESSTFRSAAAALRAHVSTWVVTALLPLPILVTIDPASSAMIACVYLGLGCAWLAMEIYRAGGLPTSRRGWAGKQLAICLAVAANVVAFVACGLVAGVQTSFPFLLMAALSAMPAAGMIPALVRQFRKPHAVMVFGCILVLGAKLLACIVARVRYGPDYIAQGYVSADWHTAKLMISLFWIFSAFLSVAMLLVERWRCGQVFARVVPGRATESDPTAVGSAV
jgi:hypothetical protein